MSKKANPTFVGVFVLGAILIAVGAIVFLGTTKLFTKEKRCICFFQQSVAGLQVGSAVKFKGVPIGQVKNIQIRFNADATTYVKILFNINTDTVVNNLGADFSILDEGSDRKQTNRGLRATLAYESLITGLLYVELDYHENAPPPVFLQGDTTYVEVPTLPSNIEAILENATKAVAKLGKVDFDGLSKDLQDLLQTANKGLSQIQFEELSAAIKRAADSISGLAASPDVKDTLSAARTALVNLDRTLTSLQAQIDPLGKQLTPTLEQLRKTLVGLQKTTTRIDSTLAPEGDLRYQLNGTLGELGEMAKSLQRLSEFLERNPNALIFGRKPPANPKHP